MEADEGRTPSDLAPVATAFCQVCKALPGEKHTPSRHKVTGRVSS